MQTIYDLTLKQMQEMLEAHGRKAYRAKQIFSWLYRKRVSSFDEMSDLPKSFIEQLKQEYSIEPLKEIQRQVSHDGTIKFLAELQDGSSVELVLMHFQYGDSLCVTSQV